MKEYRLNIDPRILELLGPNLYTNIYYVLAELIANAYDADARNVYIISNRDDIRIEDDGHGMSYESGEITKYLNVAGESRKTAEESMTKSGERRKMGRKGIGKLAALSVSKNVDILTVADGERSGFILTRCPEDGHSLESIPEDQIVFDHIENHGTSIIMRNPQYQLHQSLNAIKRNILRIFPLINTDFQIHIIQGEEKVTINSFDCYIMKSLCALITLDGENNQFSHLCQFVNNTHEDRRSELIEQRNSKKLTVRMKDNTGQEKDYTLEVCGWIGAYKTVRGRKSALTDFPDNFISLFANKKMGEFNILPNIGKNKLNEVYIVGQLHVDLFELTELPDMALSNRQGYKSEDPRYEAVRKYVQTELLPEILRRRDLFASLNNMNKKKQKAEKQKQNEDRLKVSVDTFKKKVIEETSKKLKVLKNNVPLEIETIISTSINDHISQLGLKSIAAIQDQKKKILISQTYADKDFADIVYQMLLFNNIDPADILYTNCDDEECRVPENHGIYDYLRTFFVDSYSRQKIFVLFVTSNNTKTSWGALTEIGASWITQMDHKIFNIQPFRPEKPLDDEKQWQTTMRDEKGQLQMTSMNADVFCAKIEAVCDALGYTKKKRQQNKEHLGTMLPIIKDTQ